MTLIDRARALLSDDGLRGRVPDEVQAFLRKVAELEPVAWRQQFDTFGQARWVYIPGRMDPRDVHDNGNLCEALYTLEPRHDPE